MAFEEVGVLQRLHHLPGVCNLVNYGVTYEGICLVLPKYRCNLRQWRGQHKPQAGKQQAQLYLHIFSQLVQLVQVGCGWTCCNSACCVNTWAIICCVAHSHRASRVAHARKQTWHHAKLSLNQLCLSVRWLWSPLEGCVMPHFRC